jgi:hypothetical protein
MQKFGIGLESEGFVLDSEGYVIPTIEEQPTVQYLLQRLAKEKPALLKYLSPELASFIVEIKSDVFKNEDQAIDQILEIRALVDYLLEPHHGKLIFQPVLDKPFEFFPSTLDPSQRAFQLAQRWGSDADSVRNLRASSICSFQISDSRPFKNPYTGHLLSTERCLELARRIHNQLSLDYHDLRKLNQHHPDFYGKTREEYYYDLVTKVDGPNIVEIGGFDSPFQAVIPPYFADIKAMKRWMSAFSGTTSFAEAECKNEHAITAKIKRKPFYAVETRLFDAVDTKREMQERARAIRRILTRPLSK